MEGMDCEYHKYGCTSRPANADHHQLHLAQHASLHLRLVVNLLEKEVEKNRGLQERVRHTEGKVEKLEQKVLEYDEVREKIKGYERRFEHLQALLESKQQYTLTPQVTSSSKRNSLERPVLVVEKEKEKRPPSPSPFVEQQQPPSQPENGDKVVQWAPSSTGGGVVGASAGVSDSDKKENGSNNSNSSSSDKDAVPEGKKEERPKISSQRSRGDLGEIGSLPPFIVKSSTLDMEASARAHTPMSLREESPSPSAEPRGRPKGKTWSNATREREVKPIINVSQDSPEVSEEYETGIVWEYDPTTDKWSRGFINFKLEKKAFSEGSLRAAHIVQVFSDVKPVEEPPDPAVQAGRELKDSLPEGLNKLGNKFVAKISKTRVPVERYFEDVKMQMLCAELGKKFNMFNVPKKVDFLHAWVLEIPRNPTVFYGLEAYIEGDFKKHNTNSGPVLTVRNTPQAFSHFTWENSKHTRLVVDLQGVNDFYTDPQIHTIDSKGFGLGNLGKSGIERFLKTHQCNAICQLLTLPRINAMDTKEAKQKLMRGTQQVPFIEDQLQPLQVPQIELPDDLFSGGEFQCTQTLTGHVDRVVSLCATPKYLFSGSGDGSVRVWSLPSMTFEKELNVHRKSVETMCVNDRYLFTGSADHSVKVWEIGNFNLVIALRDHVGEVNAVCLTDKSLNYLISASFDKNIKVWNLRNFKCMQTLAGHSKSVKSLAVSGSILFSGSNDGSIYVWNLKYMSCIFTIDAHDGWVKTLGIKDNVLYSGSYDYRIKKWDLTTFNCLATISEHNDNVNSICLTDRHLLSASEEKTVLIIDLVTHKVVGSLKGHRSGVQDVVTDGKTIFTSSDDCTIKAWKWCSA